MSRSGPLRSSARRAIERTISLAGLSEAAKFSIASTVVRARYCVTPSTEKRPADLIEPKLDEPSEDAIPLQIEGYERKIFGLRETALPELHLCPDET